MNNQQLATIEQNQSPTLMQRALSLPQILEQRGLIISMMREAMTENLHFGKIPGCGDKPSLLQPGAQMLATTFRLVPTYRVTSKQDGEHRTESVVCALSFEGRAVAEGVGICSTMESKYRYRTDWKTKEKFDNPNPADTWNTVLKIAKKRAYVDAVISATACNDLFTQDLEDIKDNMEVAIVSEARTTPAPRQQQRPAAPSRPANAGTGGAVTVVGTKIAKEGTSKTGKLWALHVIKFSDGTETTTFDSGLYNAAVKYEATEQPVSYGTKPGLKEGQIDLVGISAVDVVADMKAPEPPDDVDMGLEKSEIPF